MMAILFRFTVVLAVFARCFIAQQIVNGQIYTPGIALVDSPQPNTPEGGGKLLANLELNYADLEQISYR